MEAMDTSNSPTRNPPRPIYNRSRSQHGPETLTTFNQITLGGKRSLGAGLSIARSFDEFYASTNNGSSTGILATNDNETVNGSGAGTGSGSSKQGGGKHFSSSTVKISGKKNSHSRGDIEFWASLYAQHKVYTRQVSKTAPESLNSNSPNSQSPLSSNGNNYNHNDKTNNRAPIKIWQVLTKTELDPQMDPNIKSKSSKKNHETFQFERLPIKAPTASTATASALSSNGRPFSIVFFFTIETLSNSASAKSKDSRLKKSKKSKSNSHEAPTTLWYLETAYTRLSTLHEHMELMGDFISNGSNPTNGREVTPIYIYETEKLSFEQPKDQDAPVVLDLKLQSPEGAVYAEFSYTFIKDAKPENVHISSLRSDGSTRSSKSKRNGKPRSLSQTVNSKSELDSPLKNSFSGDTDSDEDSLVEIPDIKDLPMDVVAEEPDAGEHLMQATTQFFSKMGYWLYNSKVVQYIARDERIRTKTAFPVDDIWMLGVCYQFAQEFQVEEKTLLFATDALDEAMTIEKKKVSTPKKITESNSHRPTLATTDPDLGRPVTEESQVSNSLESIKSDQVTPGRRRYTRAMSFSQFAGNAPERSAPTSSISTQEARSHSHSRSPSTSITSSILEDDFNVKSASGSRVRTLSQSAELIPKSSPGSSGSNSKSAMATMATKLSNMSINSKKDESSQNEDKSVRGMVTAAATEIGKETQEQTPPGRKAGKRRMTISELFSWDSNSPSATTKHNSIGSNGSSNNSSSITALKNIVGSGKGAGESNSKQKQSQVVANNRNVTDITDVSSTSVTDAGKQNTADILQPSAIDDESANTKKQQRERKRRTSNAVANQNSQSTKDQEAQPHPTSYGEGIILAPNPASSHVGRDYIPRTSSPLSSSHRSGAFSAKRQSSMPVSPSSSKSPKHIDNTATLSSPPLSPLLSPHSPNSSGKRSWRSLSLSLASTAKSALPLGLGSPGRTRSSLFMDGQKKNHGAGYGHDYDGDDFDMVNQDNPNSTLISLPPAIVTAMSLQRPPPAWSSVAFKSLSHEQKVLRKFLMDFQSRLWFTYRKDLARIEPSFYTCDSGWGCMMRTGQSLLAQAFVQVLLGREWRAHHTQTAHNRRRYGEILSWFVDEPDRPYSIHRIAKAGLALDKRIGEWFGPSTVAHAMKRLTQSHTDCPMSVLVPMENNIRVSTIVQAATLSQGPVTKVTVITSWRPVLLLIPTRYGLEKLTERYIPNLKQLFKMPQFLGIAGGRPGRSLYFVSCQGEELYYFDPHFVKPRVTTEEVESCPAPSFHCTVVRSMGINELDPSMLLGFLIESPGDLIDLMKKLVGPDMNKSYPLLTIQRDLDIEQTVVSNGDSQNLGEEPERKSTVIQDDNPQVLPSPSSVMTNHVQPHEVKNYNAALETDSDDQFSIKSFTTSDEEDEDEDEDEDTTVEESDDDGVLI
ncbi:Cysteine protease atg4b [Entomortierella beljakovae]|nr:Cysteine protease atg4b [Entomortierella beljakovae]